MKNYIYGTIYEFFEYGKLLSEKEALVIIQKNELCYSPFLWKHKRWYKNTKVVQAAIQKDPYNQQFI